MDQELSFIIQASDFSVTRLMQLAILSMAGNVFHVYVLNQLFSVDTFSCLLIHVRVVGQSNDFTFPETVQEL